MEQGASVDPVIVQTLVTVASFLILGTVYVVNGRTNTKVLDYKFMVVEAQMEDFKSEMKNLAKVVTQQALDSKRQDFLQETQMAQGKRLDELEKRVNLYADSPIYRRAAGD